MKSDSRAILTAARCCPAAAAYLVPLVRDVACRPLLCSTAMFQLPDRLTLSQYLWVGLPHCLPQPRQGSAPPGLSSVGPQGSAWPCPHQADALWGAAGLREDGEQEVV